MSIESKGKGEDDSKTVSKTKSDIKETHHNGESSYFQ